MTVSISMCSIMFAHRFEPQGRRFRNVHYYYYYHVSACVQTRLSRQIHWLFKHHCNVSKHGPSASAVPKQRSRGLGLYSWKREFQHTFGCLGHSACLSGRSYFGVKTDETSVKIAAFRLWIIKLPHYSPFGGILAGMCPRNGRTESV